MDIVLAENFHASEIVNSIGRTRIRRDRDARSVDRIKSTETPRIDAGHGPVDSEVVCVAVNVNYRLPEYNRPIAQKDDEIGVAGDFVCGRYYFEEPLERICLGNN